MRTEVRARYDFPLWSSPETAQALALTSFTPLPFCHACVYSEQAEMRSICEKKI